MPGHKFASKEFGNIGSNRNIESVLEQSITFFKKGRTLDAFLHIIGNRGYNNTMRWIE